MNKVTAIFCDFDGTIARRDIGYSMFHHFSGGRNDALLPAWKSLKMSSRECLTSEAAMVRGTRDEIEKYLQSFEIDSGFVAFEQLCRQNNVSLTVISDGLDLYIHPILGRNGLGHLKVMSNIGRYTANGLEIEFPWHNSGCARCGCCKGERMAEFRQGRDRTEVRLAFIGDGYSDICAIEQADLLIAKKDLARYCAERGIAYTPFDNFTEVAQILVDNGYLFRDDGTMIRSEI